MKALNEAPEEGSGGSLGERPQTLSFLIAPLRHHPLGKSGWSALRIDEHDSITETRTYRWTEFCGAGVNSSGGWTAANAPSLAAIAAAASLLRVTSSSIEGGGPEGGGGTEIGAKGLYGNDDGSLGGSGRDVEDTRILRRIQASGEDPDE